MCKVTVLDYKAGFLSRGEEGDGWRWGVITAFLFCSEPNKMPADGKRTQAGSFQQYF